MGDHTPIVAELLVPTSAPVRAATATATAPATVDHALSDGIVLFCVLAFVTGVGVLMGTLVGLDPLCTAGFAVVATAIVVALLAAGVERSIECDLAVARMSAPLASEAALRASAAAAAARRPRVSEIDVIGKVPVARRAASLAAPRRRVLVPIAVAEQRVRDERLAVQESRRAAAAVELARRDERLLALEQVRRQEDDAALLERDRRLLETERVRRAAEESGEFGSVAPFAAESRGFDGVSRRRVSPPSSTAAVAARPRVSVAATKTPAVQSGRAAAVHERKTRDFATRDGDDEVELTVINDTGMPLNGLVRARDGACADKPFTMAPGDAWSIRDRDCVPREIRIESPREGTVVFPLPAQSAQITFMLAPDGHLTVALRSEHHPAPLEPERETKYAYAVEAPFAESKPHGSAAAAAATHRLVLTNETDRELVGAVYVTSGLCVSQPFAVAPYSAETVDVACEPREIRIQSPRVIIVPFAAATVPFIAPAARSRFAYLTVSITHDGRMKATAIGAHGSRTVFVEALKTIEPSDDYRTAPFSEHKTRGFVTGLHDNLVLTNGTDRELVGSVHVASGLCPSQPFSVLPGETATITSSCTPSEIRIESPRAAVFPFPPISTHRDRPAKLAIVFTPDGRMKAVEPTGYYTAPFSDRTEHKTRGFVTGAHDHLVLTNGTDKTLRGSLRVPSFLCAHKSFSIAPGATVTIKSNCTPDEIRIESPRAAVFLFPPIATHRDRPAKLTIAFMPDGRLEAVEPTGYYTEPFSGNTTRNFITGAHDDLELTNNTDKTLSGTVNVPNVYWLPLCANKKFSIAPGATETIKSNCTPDEIRIDQPRAATIAFPAVSTHRDRPAKLTVEFTPDGRLTAIVPSGYYS